MPDEAPDVLGEAPSRSDLRLIDRALRNDWPIPSDVREKLLGRLIDLATAADDPDDEAAPGPRTRILAARTLAIFAGLTLKQQALDLAARKADGNEAGESLADMVARAEALADARERERERERADG